MLKMPEELAPELRRPWGRVYPSPSKDTLRRVSRVGILATVGDATTISFLRAGVKPDVAVVDGRIARSHRAPDVSHEFTVELRLENPPGTITEASVSVVREAFLNALDGDRTLIRVLGEEDLLTLVVLMVAPENSIVAYGLPGEGMVILRVTEALKDRVEDVLRRFRGRLPWRWR